MDATVGERTAVLVIRLWVEGDRADGLRARITRTLDIAAREERTSVVVTTDELEEVVRDWIEAFVSMVGSRR